MGMPGKRFENGAGVTAARKISTTCICGLSREQVREGVRLSVLQTLKDLIFG